MRMSMSNSGGIDPIHFLISSGAEYMDYLQKIFIEVKRSPLQK